MADRGPSPHTPLPTNNEEKSEKDNRRTRRSRSRIRSTHRRSQSRSRTFLQKFTRSRRHTHRKRTRNRSSSSDSSNSTPKRYSRKRRASSSSPVTAASRSTSDSASSESYETRKSRSRSRHPPKSKKYGKRRRLHRRTPEDEQYTLKKFLDTFSAHGSHSFHGAQNVIPSFDPSEKMQTTRAKVAPGPSRTIRCYNCSELGHTVPKCTKELQKCKRCNRLGHIIDFCKRDANQTNTPVPTAKPNESNKVLHITTVKDTMNIYNKTVKVNEVDRTAFVDFGSECTLIKNSVAADSSLKVTKDNLPVIKGFALGALQPTGKVKFDLKIDFIEAAIEAFVVPDHFLNTDLFIGHNLTELPEVVVHKTSTNLTLYSNNVDLDKIMLYCNDDVSFKGIQCNSMQWRSHWLCICAWKYNFQTRRRIHSSTGNILCRKGIGTGTCDQCIWSRHQLKARQTTYPCAHLTCTREYAPCPRFN